MAQLRPGGLAVIIGGSIQNNIGKVVTTIKCLGHFREGEIISTDGQQWLAANGVTWWVEGVNGHLNSRSAFGPLLYNETAMPALASMLMPIDDFDKELPQSTATKKPRELIE